MNASSTPLMLGWRHWILAAHAGKISSSLVLFHSISEVNKSATFRSRCSSEIGPIGLVVSSSDIQESFHTLVVWPLPNAFPRCSFRRSLPCRIPFHPCEHAWGVSTSRKFLFWQYFLTSILASKLSGPVRIRHANLARRAWLKICMSLSPKPPPALGFVSFSQETYIFLLLIWPIPPKSS